MMHRLSALAAVLAHLAFASASFAQVDADDSAKAAARELAAQGDAAFRKDDYATAWDRYRRAYAMVPAPTLAVREGRAAEKDNRLVEAMEAYVKAARTPLNAKSPPPFRSAVREANEGLARLKPLIPKLEVRIKGATRRDPGLQVTIDGKPMASALVGVPAPVNPGAHQIEAKMADGRSAQGQIELAAGESKNIDLDLGDPPPGAAAAAEPTGDGPPPAAAGGDAGISTAGSGQRTLGWVALGVGAAGLAVGVTTGLMATSKHSSAEEGCPDGRCAEGSAAADDADAFRSLRTISTIGYVIGVVGVGAGVTLHLTAKSDEPSPSVGVVVGPLSASLKGAF